MGRGRKAVLRRSLRDGGQAALAMVLGITLLLTTGGAILASTAIQHDPLVQNDVVQHYAYRALEAGSNAFLDNVNANPNLINCTASSPSGGECNPTEYNTWKQVDNTSGSGIVPEWYLWENPVFCSGTSTTTGKCIVLTGTATLAYVEVPVYGAAGFPGHINYQDSMQILTPENGFLSRVWWSNYESTDPQLTGYPADPADCTYDWATTPTAYTGPSTNGNNACSAVYFGPNDSISGPLFSNDTIWVSGDPTLGPVETADPGCLFYDASAGCITAPNNTIVNQLAPSPAGDAYKQTKEPLPQTDSSLKAIALLNGCVYYGPTTITFDTNDMMSVWSPDTSTSSSCMPSTAGGEVQVPNGAHGNGVIYVDNATTVGGQTCSETNTSAEGANPFDNWQSSTSSNGPAAQWGTVNGAFYDYAGATSSPDCEGDAFVSDNPSGGGVSGQLTIATANDIIVTGNVEYTDCSGSFTSTTSGPCSYNSGGTNDALGLIANQYVEVNHPVVPNCTTTTTRHGTTTTCTGVTSSSVLEPPCHTLATNPMGTPPAALCNPTDDTTGYDTLTIDAAILALNQSYLVNNWTIGNKEGTLIVYGSIDQDYRGAVGTFSGSSVASGYSKDYDWDSRLQFVTPPFYLTPGTPAWGLASSATDLTPGAPTCSGCGIPPT